MPNKSLSRSSLLTYQKYSSLLVGNAGYVPPVLAYDLLETVELTSSQATITLANINSTYGSTYQHLQIRATMRTDRAAQPVDTTWLRINGDGAANYSSHYLNGVSPTPTSNADVGQAYGYMGVYTAATGQESGVFSAWVADILDPFETTKATTFRTFWGLGGNTTRAVQLQSQSWRGTAAVESIVFDAAGNYVAGTRISLYGLKAA